MASPMEDFHHPWKNWWNGVEVHSYFAVQLLTVKNMSTFLVKMVACSLRMFFCTNQRLFMTDIVAYCDWAGRLNCSLLKKFNKL